MNPELLKGKISKLAAGEHEKGQRAKVDGWHKCMNTLEKLLAKPKNQRTLSLALQEVIDTAPLVFLGKYVMPFLPKNALAEKEDAENIPKTFAAWTRHYTLQQKKDQ